jgi:small membrane protein
MILVQVIMIAVIVAVAFLGLRSHGAHSVNAWKKMLFALLMVSVIVAVLSPGLVNSIAHGVGVGRGTDLVLYVVSLAFGFYVVNQYLRGQDSRNQLHRLARRIAIVEAVEKYGMDSPESATRATSRPQPGHVIDGE